VNAVRQHNNCGTYVDGNLEVAVVLQKDESRNHDHATDNEEQVEQY
jgi:hypothetical protein